ncbi:hypothetical protein GGX14DRAFT_559337 [Mycena pura]|uniref:3'-5' exonuclease domain-containing protein n=1 Tax=Mycena pura TaxID=153505 RepID=A0AAD6YKJ2_9AGAR|nr:hypothetical protein GGX14DRAFT_559335 [Mycena pura]KAJ7220547.1 hypothetical protein GGX14DRAFT_559337 [Mycena pura]
MSFKWRSFVPAVAPSESHDLGPLPPTEEARPRGRPKGSKNKRPRRSSASAGRTAQSAGSSTSGRTLSALAHAIFRPLGRSPSPTNVSTPANVPVPANVPTPADVPMPANDPTPANVLQTSLSTPPLNPFPASHHPGLSAPASTVPTPTTSPSAATPTKNGRNAHAVARSAENSAHLPSRASASASSTLQRARLAAGVRAAPSESTLPSSLSSSAPPALVTDSDVEYEYDPHSFVHDNGLGEEDDDPDSDKSKSEFPTWFKEQLKAVLADLKHDLAAVGLSRHYKNGSFWIRGKALRFLLGNKLNLKPEDTFTCDFFLWDPLSILTTSFRLPCPNPDCHGHHLTREGVVDRPRRVVDLDCCFYLIGYSYGCRGAGGCGKRFRSWDQRILDRLPPDITAEFPAHLTWRSGLSTRAFGVVRSCFQHGMGSAEVSDLFRMQHLHRYDEMRLQYLRRKFTQMELTSSGNTVNTEEYEVYPPFQDRSPRGFHGFTPSGQWLRDIYDKFIEFHRDVLNQHTAMLPGRICAIDHSHKLAKHVFKVNGVPIFTALLTVTNEKGQIVVCIFVATKAHSQFDEALHRLAHDLVVYGHSPPEVFYTDNMVDKAMLEKIFPSLLEAVVPVDKYSHLSPFPTPAFVLNPKVLDCETDINNTMQAILEDVPEDGHIVVGFDSEWNVDMTQYGRFGSHSPPAVVQIAYKDSVFILQVGEMLSRGVLPVQLVNFLRHAQVIKAGRQVGGDLGRLATACNRQPGDFRGGLDLAVFAKERFLIKKATVSLADLIALLLHQCLPKPAAERISTAWSDKELSQAQLEYAARDAYASLILYHEINKTPLPSHAISSEESLTPNTPILLLTDDNKKPAARGFVSHNATLATFKGVKITKTRTVLTICEVLIPAAIIGINKDENRRKLSLAEFGPIPFDILAHQSHVRMVPPPPLAPPSSTMSPTLTEPPEQSDGIGSASDDLVSVFESLDETDQDDSTPATAAAATADEQSARDGAAELGPEDLHNVPDLSKIRSRVLKDIFHVFHMLYISRTHGLRLAFIRAFRDACLIPHPADKTRIETYLATKKLTWDDMLRYNPRWLWRRCRRTIPPPELLYPLVHRLFMLYGPLRDAKTNLPLFNTAAWKIAKNILELVRNGYVSDVPGVVLYYCIGFDAEAGGLPLYRCIRGTNMVEGGVHTHLLAKLPSRGASVRHMVACLLDFVLRHNLTVGHFNSTGKKYTGHDSIWLTNKIQEFEITLGDHYGKQPRELSWVNGNLYRQSEQSVGIMKIPKSICAAVEIQPYHLTEDSKQKHAYIAKMHNTRIPLFPVHTVAEKQLFARLMLESEEFRKCKTSITTSATIVWNRHAELEEDVYYKVEENLTSYFNGPYKDGANIRLSCARVRDQTSALDKELRNPSRSERLVNTRAGELVPLRVTSGFAPDDYPNEEASSSTPSTYERQFAAANHVPIDTAQATIRASLKHAAEEAAIGQPATKHVKIRLCPRCRDPQCDGTAQDALQGHGTSRVAYLQ